MKKLFLWTVVSTSVFAVTLEIISWVALSSGLGPSFSFPPGLIHRQEDLLKEAQLPTRRGEIGRVFQRWLGDHPELKKDLVFDRDLRSETARYTNIGVRTGKSLFTSFDRIAPDLDDDFEVYGRVSGKLKYRVHYRTTETGSRETLSEKIPGARANIIFLGCSFTFAEGVPTAESYPAVLGKLLKTVRVHNYGVPGSSPSLRLMVMNSNPDMFKGIDPSLPTIVIYVFIDDHIRRVIGTSELFARDGQHYWSLPEYSLENGSLVFRKSFSDNFLNFRWLALAYSKTHFAQATRLELPPVGDSHFELISVLLSEMRKKIASKLPELRDFYVANFIGEHYYFRSLTPFIEAKGLKVLDYSGIDFHSFLGDHFFLPGDFHPSSVTNDLYATLLENDLKRILKGI